MVKQFVKALSPKVEFSIVLLGAFGYPILSSLLSVLSPTSSGAHISEANLQFLLVYEAIVFVTLWLILVLRGWRFHDVGLMPSWRDSLIGVVLALFMYIIDVMLWLLFGQFVPGLYQHAAGIVTPDLGFVTVMAVSILNPVFEEVFVCGYIITALKKSRSLSFAVNVSVAVRLAYHLYQGALSVFNIIPLGIIYAYWYGRTGRLWPLVIAHGIFDFLALVYYATH